MSDYILGLDVGSVNICATIAKVSNDDISVLGTGRAKTLGIKKGIITNIEQAAHSIKEAVSEAKKTSGVKYDTCIVSISGSYAKGVKSQGVVTINNSEITTGEIERVVKIAEENAEIPSDYQRLHTLPYNFRVGDQDEIEDPLGMSGARLEVSTYIIVVPSSGVRNLKKAVELAGVGVDNIVLSAYASSIAVLNHDEKELGVALIDMGGATCESVVHLGNSLIYGGVFPVGSSLITSDLSKALHTPLPSAERLKLQLARLINEGLSSIDIPILGEDGDKEISLEQVSEIISARVEETLMYLANQISQSGYLDRLGAGIILTGGMAKLDGIRDLAMAIFNNIPVRIAKPKKVSGLSEFSDDPQNSCVLGLCLYGAGNFTPYELDSNGDFRYRGESPKKGSNYEKFLDDAINKNVLDQDDWESIKLSNNQMAENISKDGNASIFGFFKKIWIRLTQMF